MEQFLPLTPAVFHILLALATGEKHGYAMMQEVEQLTDGQLRLAPGTLYRSIKQLVEGGLIEESHQRPISDDDERRRYYRLTERGKQVLNAEARRLHQIVKVAQERGVLPL